MADPFDQLRAKYPKFIFTNKTKVTQTVALADGDSVQVHEHGTLKLDSSKFNNFPSSNKFKFVQPTFDDLREVGLLPTTGLPPVAKTVEPASDTE